MTTAWYTACSLVKVPCTVDGSQKLIESNIISEYLDRKYNESGIKLFPRDAVSLAKVTRIGRLRYQLFTWLPKKPATKGPVQVRWFVEVLSTGLVPGFVGLVHSKTQQDARQAKEKLTHCLKVWYALVPTSLAFRQ